MFRNRILSAPPVLETPPRALSPRWEARVSGQADRTTRRGTTGAELTQMPPTVLRTIVEQAVSLGSDDQATTGRLAIRAVCKALNETTLVVLTQKPELSDATGCGYVTISSNPKDRIDMYVVSQHKYLRHMPHTLVIDTCPKFKSDAMRPSLEEEFSRFGNFERLKRAVPLIPKRILQALEAIFQPSTPQTGIFKRRQVNLDIQADSVGQVLLQFSNLQRIEFIAEKSALGAFNMPHSRQSPYWDLENHFVGGMELMWLSSGLRLQSMSELHAIEPDCTFEWSPTYFERLVDCCSAMPLETLSLCISAKCCAARQTTNLARLGSPFGNTLRHLYVEYMEGQASRFVGQCPYCHTSTESQPEYDQCFPLSIKNMDLPHLETLALRNISLDVVELIYFWCTCPTRAFLMADHEFSHSETSWATFWTILGSTDIYNNRVDGSIPPHLHPARALPSEYGHRAQNHTIPQRLHEMCTRFGVDFVEDAECWFMEL